MPAPRNPLDERAIVRQAERVHLTLYPGTHGANAIAQDDFSTWGELVESLRDLVSRPPEVPESASPEAQKESLLAFAPHRLKPGITRRALQNIAHVTLLVLDLDHGIDLPALLERVDDLHSPAIVYASPSDTPNHRRVRVIASVSRPIAVGECARTRFAFAERLGLEPGCGVELAHDAAKIFFAGRLHGTPDREFYTWY